MMMTDGLAALVAAQARVTRAVKRLEKARDDRDAMIVRFIQTGTPYRLLAKATGLSIASIGKIAAARGVRKYRDGKEPATT